MGPYFALIGFIISQPLIQILIKYIYIYIIHMYIIYVKLYS
jgi:hypothetical protein